MDTESRRIPLGPPVIDPAHVIGPGTYIVVVPEGGNEAQWTQVAKAGEQISVKAGCLLGEEAKGQ